MLNWSADYQNEVQYYLIFYYFSESLPEEKLKTTNLKPTWGDAQKRAGTDVGKSNSLSTNNIIIHSLILATMVLS